MEVTDVLVTGGTGKLGTRVAERLRAGGLRPRVMSRSGKSGTVKGNLLTGEGLREAVTGTDAIIHAAQNPTRKTRETFVRGTERLLRAAEEAGVSHVLYPSIVGI
jgi:nucleoside-diphosphate-sugar epimerase